MNHLNFKLESNIGNLSVLHGWFCLSKDDIYMQYVDAKHMEEDLLQTFDHLKRNTKRKLGRLEVHKLDYVINLG